MGHGPDLSVGIFDHQDAPRAERLEERARSRVDPEQDEVRPDAVGVERAVGSGWAMPPG